MIFAAPMFLYLLPAAGLPILFHFFLKQKKRQILFPTLMFFYRTDPRMNARRKLHQLLLLLMRVLLIAFILLALSRPKFQSAVGVGGKLSVVAVVDNSGSMSDSADNDTTKLELAVDGARDLVTSLGDKALMNVITLVEDPILELGDSLTDDRESLLTGLDEITPTAATGDAVDALARAFNMIQSDSGSGGVVHVFSDLQQSEWDDDALQTASADSSIKVYFHKIESQSREQPNVAISSVQFPQRKILPKHPFKVGVVCRNNSQSTATIRLNSVDSQDNKNTQEVVLEPGKAQTVEVEINPEAPGYHWLRAWIEGDNFSADNEAGIGILCGRTATVLFSGSRAEFGVLPTAFSPDEYGQYTGMISRFTSLNETLQDGADKPVLVVMTWEEIRQLGQTETQVRKYVENGGNLLIVPSLKRISARGKPPQWLGANTELRKSEPAGIKLEALETDSVFWNRLREATGDVTLGGARVLTFYPLALSDDFTRLMGTGFDQVILAHKKLGQGNIYASGTAFDPRWNTLPLTGLIVVMAQSIATEGTWLEQDSMISLIAGQQPEGISVGGKQADVTSLTGEAIEWKGPASEIPAFSKPGVYLAKSGDKEYCVSVRSSDKEGLTQFVTGSQIAALNRVTHEIFDYNPSEGFARFHAGQSRTFNMFLPLVLLATLALLVEGWLANPIKSKAEKSAQLERTTSEVPVERAENASQSSDSEVLIGGGAG